jgi:hypothetical protein
MERVGFILRFRMSGGRGLFPDNLQTGSVQQLGQKMRGTQTEQLRQI